MFFHTSIQHYWITQSSGSTPQENLLSLCYIYYSITKCPTQNLNHIWGSIKMKPQPKDVCSTWFKM